MSDYLTQDARNDQPLQDLHTLLQSSSSNGGYFYGAVRSIITMRLQWTISAATDSGSP